MSSEFTPKPGRLMEQVRETLRFHHYAYITEKVYVQWILRYIRFHDRKHPFDMGKDEIEAFLSHLATTLNVTATTQNQAMNAILFLYREVLKADVDYQLRAIRSNKPRNLPTVLSREEISRLFNHLDGTKQLIIELMYAAGLRVSEALNLRVQDFDFDNKQIYIRDSKGGNNRISLFPGILHARVEAQIEKVRLIHKRDLARGYGEISLPGALSRKIPSAGKSLNWQYVFPSTTISANPHDGLLQRYHLHDSVINKALKLSSSNAKLRKRVTSHVMRHSFATHLLEDGVNIRKVQTLLGHKDVRTTEIYTHVMDKSSEGITSPLENLEKL
jgi:integron integrase